MNDTNDLATDAPKDPVTHPEIPQTTDPTKPEGTPDPPLVPEDPYPVIDPPIEPDTEPAPVEDPVPLFPEPIPGGPRDAHFR